MPHLVIEHSANLAKQVDLQKLCQALHATLLDIGLFELGAIRVRAFSAPNYAVADQKPANTFADLSFRIGVGRSAEDKKRTGEAIMATAKDFFAPLLKAESFALSLEIREIDPAFSWRENGMHQRLRKA